MIKYKFEYKIYNLTPEERKPFDISDRRSCVHEGSLNVFKLKNGEKITGKVLKITNIDPIDMSDNEIQALFEIETKGGKIIELRFYEIESHSPRPFKRNFLWE